MTGIYFIIIEDNKRNNHKLEFMCHSLPRLQNSLPLSTQWWEAGIRVIIPFLLINEAQRDEATFPKSSSYQDNNAETQMEGSSIVIHWITNPSVLITTSVLCASLFFLNPHLRICLLILEILEGRERETSMGCLPYMHRPEIEPTTFWCMGWHSKQPSQRRITFSWMFLF